MSQGGASPLLGAMKAHGGVAGAYRGLTVVRHFGDPAAEYAAATQSVAVLDRSHRARLVVRGRAPGQMLNGILTGTMPDEPTSRDDGILRGRGTYHAVLTPKGKMLTDLWAYRLGEEETDGYLLDVPVAGRENLLENFSKVLPPRFAKVEDVSGTAAHLTLVGPGAADLLSGTALGLRVEAHQLSGLDEGEWVAVGRPLDALMVVGTGEVDPDAYHVFGPAGALVALWKTAVAQGARPAGLGVWQTLRVEAGRPTYGADMDEGTIPVEAGIHDRAIDYVKGCYTGQEVIVRIRDRGKVNRTLRRILLGEIPTPLPGAKLFLRGEDGRGEGKPVGWVTSAVQSPRFGQTVALGYLRREVDEADVVVGD